MQEPVLKNLITGFVIIEGKNKCVVIFGFLKFLEVLVVEVMYTGV